MGRPRMQGGELLAARLDEKGLSRADLCEMLDATEGAISRWISGDRTPSLEMAHKLEKALGIPTESWLDAKAG